MKRHLAYLKTLLRHKYYVFIACRKLRVPLWRAIIHDWHKFLPSEWGPYARTFYKPDGSKQYNETLEFNRAWNLHQKRGKHHHQHWLLTMDRGETIALPMQDVFVMEMLADWYGAGKAYTGEWRAHLWYAENKQKMNLEVETRMLIEDLLNHIVYQGVFTESGGRFDLTYQNIAI